MTMSDITPGIYAHYKGNTYEVIGTAKHSETLEDLVIYIAQYGDCDMWVLPLAHFTRKVRVDNEWIPRFTRVE
jgi:hypothetical protein